MPSGPAALPLLSFRQAPSNSASVMSHSFKPRSSAMRRSVAIWSMSVSGRGCASPQIWSPRNVAAHCARRWSGTCCPRASFMLSDMGTYGLRKFLRPMNWSRMSKSGPLISAWCFLRSFRMDLEISFLMSFKSVSVAPSRICCFCF